MRTRIEVVGSGPAGTVHYHKGPYFHSLPWEIGGLDVLVTIYVPSPDDWDAALPWAAGRRTEVLMRLGRAMGEYPFGRVEIGERWVNVLEPRPPWRVVGAWLTRLTRRGARTG